MSPHKRTKGNLHVITHSSLIGFYGTSDFAAIDDLAGKTRQHQEKTSVLDKIQLWKQSANVMVVGEVA